MIYRNFFLIIIIIILMVENVFADDVIFSRRGTIFGKVYIDENDNGRQDEGEPGIEGVLIILVNGIKVTTGPNGKYSIPDMSGGFYVIELDDWTLPPGIVLISDKERSKFINLPESGTSEINFRVKNDL